LRLERSLTNSPALFVSLKGRHRGQAMTSAGLRSLFRHHRVLSQVRQANPIDFVTPLDRTWREQGCRCPPCNT
jgi:hypothetical protein